MKKSGLRAVAVAAGAIAAVPASATLVNVSQTVTLSQIINGSATNLNFDVSTFLANQGLAAGNIVSGQLIAYGLSDQTYGAAQPSAYSGYAVTGYTSHVATGYYYVPGYTYYVPYYYSYQCGYSWWGGAYYCGATGYYQAYSPGYSQAFNYSITDTIVERTRDIQHNDNVADTVTVTVGGSNGSDTASQTSSSAGAYGAATSDGSVCATVDSYGNCSIEYRYSRERDTYSAIYGPLSVSLGLDGTALTDIRSDGNLGYSLAMDAGWMRLTEVTLNLVVDRVDGGASNTVPEPGGIALSALALAAAAGVRRRRREPTE